MMRAKDYLKQLQKLNRMIENKLMEKEQWKTIACGISAPTAPETGVRVQTSGSQQKMEDAVARYVDMDAEIDQAIDSLVDTRAEIISVIEQLPPTQYDLLHKAYVGVVEEDTIHYMTLPEIADLYQRSRSWANVVHGRALANVQKILDERERNTNGEIQRQ